MDKRFNPDELTAEAAKERVIKDEVLGEIRYRPLTIRQAAELMKIADPQERGFQVLLAKLKPCYPGLTREQMDAWDDGLAARLIQAISEDEDFRVGRTKLPRTSSSKSLA